MNDTSRRNFMVTSIGTAAAALLLPEPAMASERSLVYEGGLVSGQPKPLPYKSIPGFLSAEQITPHHTAHYGGALRGFIAADKELQSGVSKRSSIDANAYGALQRARTNKANSVLLHELYFDGMTAKASKPGANIKAAIEKHFGSLDQWATDFQASAKAASGWAVLAMHQLNGKLYNIVSDKHATGLLWMATPLIVIDVYEHAFYVDYQNHKGAYIEKFMPHINWAAVDRRFRNAR